jgi:uncharacterized coiled-coil DUF342 family protein
MNEQQSDVVLSEEIKKKIDDLIGKVREWISEIRDTRRECEKPAHCQSYECTMRAVELEHAHAEIAELKASILDKGGWSEVVREKDAEIERLKQSMSDHFTRQHLEGDGPKIDRLEAERDKLRADLTTVRKNAREMARAIGNALDMYRNGSYYSLAEHMANELVVVDVSNYVDE